MTRWILDRKRYTERRNRGNHHDRRTHHRPAKLAKSPAYVQQTTHLWLHLLHRRETTFTLREPVASTSSDLQMLLPVCSALFLMVCSISSKHDRLRPTISLLWYYGVGGEKEEKRETKKVRRVALLCPVLMPNQDFQKVRRCWKKKYIFTSINYYIIIILLHMYI